MFGRLKEKTKSSLLPIVTEECNDPLEQRVKNLEIFKSFLERYVVDTLLLTEIVENERNKLESTTTNDSGQKMQQQQQQEDG